MPYKAVAGAVDRAKKQLAEQLPDSRRTYHCCRCPDPSSGRPVSVPVVGARLSQRPPCRTEERRDRGIDGRLFFHDEAESAKTKQVIISVKAGHTGPAHVRDLRGVVEKEKASIGLLITMEDPTAPMRKESAAPDSMTPRGEPSIRNFRFSPWANCWTARRSTPRLAETSAHSRSAMRKLKPHRIRARYSSSLFSSWAGFRPVSEVSPLPRACRGARLDWSCPMLDAPPLPAGGAGRLALPLHGFTD